ncbi:tubulin folding cofactor E [Phyllostomus discolor]|uniref:Tubulin folding cofactor E n=1 Tax=Phyllostomus discolor TaxID=89673 RepID=A0A833YGD8_9CHIR|nr:tubulin folding cofactor E [Phyllostomus discolor]
MRYMSCRGQGSHCQSVSQRERSRSVSKPAVSVGRSRRHCGSAQTPGSPQSQGQQAEVSRRRLAACSRSVSCTEGSGPQPNGSDVGRGAALCGGLAGPGGALPGVERPFHLRKVARLAQLHLSASPYTEEMVSVINLLIFRKTCK